MEADIAQTLILFFLLLPLAGAELSSFFLMIFVSQCIFRIFPKDATLPPHYQPKSIRPPNIFWDNLFQLFWENPGPVRLRQAVLSLCKKTSAYRADRSAIRQAEASVFPSFFSQLKS